MKYGYNGNLLENERINIVSNEIINKYPFIKIEDAKKAAMLEGTITSEITNKEKIMRLYNIMLVKRNDKQIVKKILHDFVELMKESNDYFILAEDIYKFTIGRCDFPFLDNYKKLSE